MSGSWLPRLAVGCAWLAWAGALVGGGHSVAAQSVPTNALTGTWAYRYAGTEGGASFTGIDGYIRGSATTAVTGGAHRADWINICGSPTSCAAWVQTGMMQGYATSPTTTISSPTAETMYLEYQSECAADHKLRNLGIPPTADYAFYISYTGISRANSCNGHTEYQFAIRIGSWLASPIDTGYLPASVGPVEAEEELGWDTSTASQPPSNTDMFGCDPSFQPVASHGLNVQVSGSFQSWTPSNDSGAFTFADYSMSITPKASLWAFWTS